jgi:anti-sigma factor RsiW
MEMIPTYLRDATLAARSRLVVLSREVAAGGVRPSAPGLQDAMAAAAREAIFADAVLGAVRARLEELRTATR